jgi:tRNA threonylcarbamoyladenosine modification (KEOPS) complex Cgi121 subunit
MGLFEGNYIQYTKKKIRILGIRKGKENLEVIQYKNFTLNHMEIDEMRTPIGSEKREQNFDAKISPRNTVPRSNFKTEDFDSDR